MAARRTVPWGSSPVSQRGSALLAPLATRKAQYRERKSCQLEHCNSYNDYPTTSGWFVRHCALTPLSATSTNTHTRNPSATPYPVITVPSALPVLIALYSIRSTAWPTPHPPSSARYISVLDLREGGVQAAGVLHQLAE